MNMFIKKRVIQQSLIFSKKRLLGYMSVRFSNVRLSNVGLKVGSSYMAANGYLQVTSGLTSPYANLSAAPRFTGNYATLSNVPWAGVFTGPTGSTAVSNVKTWSATALTASNGTVTFYPTTTSTAGGSPLFSSIMYIGCSPWLNTSSAISVPNVAGKSISSDLTTIVFNCVVGSAVLLGGTSSSFAGANIACMCTVMGL